MSQKTYEFTEEQNSLFKTLAMRMRLFGTSSLLVGLGILFGAALLARSDAMDQSVALLAGFVLNAVYFFVLGGPTWAASKDFQKIVETSNSDIANLMHAVDRLRKIFWLNCLIAIALFVLQWFVPAFVMPDLTP